MSDFQSIWKVTLSLLLVPFERKTCSPFDNCLTFDSLLRPIRRCCFFFIYIYVGHLEERQHGRQNKKQCCHFPQTFQRQAFSTAINIRYHKCCAHSFPFYLLFIFSLRRFWTNPVLWEPIATSRAQEKKSFPVSKNVNRPKVRQRVNWTIESNRQAPRISSERPLPHCEIVNLLLYTWHFSESACSPPLGHCRYIFLYRFRICSTVNYQLYVILEERAGVKQQSHQSLWLHNSCHPYSNKIYRIVNHQDANVRHVCVCVCAQERW